MQYLGIDVGGANLKVATIDGDGFEVPFAFWQQHHEFAQTLKSFSDQLKTDAMRLGVTMTAELADCFETKEHGVTFIVETMEDVLGHLHPLYYQTNGQMVSAKSAARNWRETAASNWHATASFLGQRNKIKSGLLIDVGSTTVDIIPIQNGQPLMNGLMDFDRLANRQLVYAGIGRTPISGLVQQVEHDGTSIGLARELFATIDDALIWLGDVQPDENDEHTADGRTRSRVNARSRLARMVCADRLTAADCLIDSIARAAKQRLIELIADAVRFQLNIDVKICPHFYLVGKGQTIATEAIRSLEFDDDTIVECEIAKAQLIPAQAVAYFRQRADEQQAVD
ncbi:MAG: hydantoinase/oxoprolinase family protein [Planctomycetota bacterium]